MRHKQLELDLYRTPKRLSFGGALNSGKRKEARPISTKDSMHLVMRSSKAKGLWSMLRKKKTIETTVARQARHWQVRVIDFVNVGNHLHLIIRVRSPRAFRGFVRSVSGLIARIVTGAQRSSLKTNLKHKVLQGQFWDERPFTRIIRGGHSAIEKVARYLQLNKLEALGFDRSQLSETRHHWILGLPMREFV